MRNLKKVIALVAVFAMMVSTVAFAQTFTDVADDHDYYEAIEMLSSLEILTGDDQDGDGKVDFRPNDTITRAEVAAIVSRIQGINSAAQTATEFVDVPSTHWASGYVAQAAGQGIVNGYGDGNFGPEDPVLYEQAVKMLVETLGYAPFVSDNGGYPTGHLTAASRYGVLDGVVGGAQGAQATRGMVAQMVYNAIDTPLMDRWTYGADAEYVIYNGKGDYDYVSLLNRDLGVKKYTGIVTENQVTGLAATKTIDTDDVAEVVITPDYTDDYYNYDCNEIDTLYEGDSNAGELLGKHVNVYVKETGRKGDYEVISVAATNKNKTIELNLDQFAKVEGNYLEYYKNESDRTTTKVKLEEADNYDSEGYVVSDFNVIYNNVAEPSAKPTDLNTILGDKTYSGKVTLVDNDSTSGYDVAFVEIGAVGVVEDVSANGKVNFKQVPRNSIRNAKIELKFDEDDTTQIIKLTKDGVAIDYTELQEWDVLSILYNDPTGYYVAEVVESGKIEGSITGSTESDTSAYIDDSKSPRKFTINGTAYDVAKGYVTNANKIAVGSAGVFYIDNYGKIVAYDKNGSTSASDKYGYILAVSDPIPSTFSDTENINVLLLDKSGEIYEAQLADKVTIENPETADAFGTLSANGSINLKDLEVGELGKALLGQLITYDSNSAGEIDEIVFPLGKDGEEEGTLWQAAKGAASYDEEDLEIAFGTTKFEITEETIVFFINNDDDNAGFGVTASKTTSKVGTVAALATDDSLNGAVYDVDGDVPAVLVLFNSTGGISPATNAAVIDEVGSAYVDGEDVVSVTYFLNGEKVTATTSPDLSNDDVLANATQGDIWKFSVVDGVIIEAREYFDVDVAGRKTLDAGEGGILALNALNKNGDLGVGTRNEDWYFGPAVDYSSNNKRIKIANVGKDGKYVLTDTTSVRAAGANVYVYDPMKQKNKLEVGDASDVYVDEWVITAENGIKVSDKGATSVDKGELPLGMLDFVAATAYDGDVLDVVIYKAYEFSYDIIDAE